MGEHTRKMNRRQARSVNRWPCDGVPRFTVKGHKTPMPYSIAFEAIFHEEECSKNEKGGLSFSREGAKRIAHLNERYTKIAHRFISVKLKEQLEAALARRAANQKPEPDPDAQPVELPSSTEPESVGAAPGPVS